MSDTTDVKTLTINTPTVFNTSAAIDRVKIHNDSSMYLRVYFGADAPTDPTSGGGWHDTIGPGASPVVFIVGASSSAFANRSYKQSTPFLGVITVMPFLPTGAAVPSGIIIGASFCYLTAYYEGEPAESGGQVEAFVQAAKQGRYQEVIGGANGWQSAQPAITNQSTADNTNLGSLGAATLFLTPANAPALFAANAAGQSIVNMYIYGYQATLIARTPAVAVADIFVAGVLSDAGFVARAVGAVIPMYLTARNFERDRFVFDVQFPLISRLIIPQGQLTSGDLLGFVYHVNSVRGAFDIAHNYRFEVDVINQSQDRNLSASNVQTNVPFNPVYNPQTY